MIRFLHQAWHCKTAVSRRKFDASSIEDCSAMCNFLEALLADVSSSFPAPAEVLYEEVRQRCPGSVMNLALELSGISHICVHVLRWFGAGLQDLSIYLSIRFKPGQILLETSDLGKLLCSQRA